MKKLILLTLFCTAPFIWLQAQLSGIKTIGEGGDYTSLNEAAQDVNANGLNGHTVFEVLDGYSQSGYCHLEAYPGNDQFTLTIRPEEGATDVILEGAGGAVFHLDSTNHVIIDGRPGGTGDAGAVIFGHSNTGNSSTIWLDHARNTIVRHCMIRHDGTRAVDLLYADSSLVEYCDIATFSTGPASNASTMGISISRSSNSVIRNNRIHNLHVASVMNIYGILMEQMGTAASVDSIYNNFIALNTDHTDSSVTVRGIHLRDDNDDQSHVYHNTLCLGGQSIKDGSSYALLYDGNGAGYIMNNIFMNHRSNGSGAGSHYGIYIDEGAEAVVNSDHNLILSDGSGGFAGFHNGFDYTTLTEWQANTVWDVHSVSKAVEFVDLTYGDLHLAGGSLEDEELFGTYLGEIYDIDGDPRWADSTFMGADQPWVCIPGLPDPDNIIENGNFEACTLVPWSLYVAADKGVEASMELVNGECVIGGINIAEDPVEWDLQLNQELSASQVEKLEIDSTYIISFDAWAEAPDRLCRISFEQSTDPWANLFQAFVTIGTEKENHSWEFVLDAVYDEMQVSFQLGSDNTTTSFDNVKLIKKIGGSPSVVVPHERTESRLFPNPASGVITVMAEDGAVIRLYNTMGTTLRSGTAVNGQVRLSTSGLKGGIYFVEVSDGTGIAVLKVILQ